MNANAYMTKGQAVYAQVQSKLIRAGGNTWDITAIGRNGKQFTQRVGSSYDAQLTEREIVWNRGKIISCIKVGA